MFKIFLSCSHKKTSPEGEWGDARRAGGVAEPLRLRILKH